MNPVLSIITVNYNNNDGLKKTLASVRMQSYESYEHIIVDAGSSDGSKETIAGYSRTPDSRLAYWVSEPDGGIYDGMNKGIAQARGEYLYFLNSGDCLLDDILKDIPFDGTPYICGNIWIVRGDKKKPSLLLPVRICHFSFAIHCRIRRALFIGRFLTTNGTIPVTGLSRIGRTV